MNTAQTIIASVRFVAREGYALFVNDIREDEYFSYEERVACLRKANDVFDKELMDAAEKYKHTPYGAYLWFYTAVFLRSENNTDLIRVRFIQELIYLLAEKSDAYIVKIETWWPKAFLTDLQQKNVTYRVNQILFIKYWLRERLKWSYESALAFKKNAAYIFKTSNPSFEGILIDANKAPTRNRLDDLSNWKKIPYEKRFFSGQEHQMIGFKKDEVVVFRRELSFPIFIKGIRLTLQAGLFLLKAKRHISQGLASYLSGIFDIRLLDLILYGLAAEKYFRKCSLKHIVHVSTMTKPTYRLLMAKAKSNSIPFTLVSSRSLKSLSSSERLLKCDVLGYSNTVLPDYFIMRDRFSTKVFKQYPELLEKTFIGGRFMQKEATNPQKQFKNGIGLLIMFTHIKSVCESILAEIDSLILDKEKISTVYFRSHPSFPVPEQWIKNVANGIPVKDISEKSYNELEEQQIITISGPTTGTLEAVNAGAIILWIPYVWSDGILLDEFMDTIGQKCINSAVLKSFFDLFLANQDLLKSAIVDSLGVVNKQFTTSTLISKRINEIINQTTN